MITWAGNRGTLGSFMCVAFSRGNSEYGYWIMWVGHQYINRYAAETIADAKTACQTMLDFIRANPTEFGVPE